MNGVYRLLQCRPPSLRAPLQQLCSRVPLVGQGEQPAVRDERRVPLVGQGEQPALRDDRRAPLIGQGDPALRDEKKLLRELCAKIRFTGPLTVAEYMREVAVNPLHGVYTSREALGREGHFVTSPEISPMFGESLAIWFLNEWMKMGEPGRFQLVELGPGKGTLMADILATLARLQPGMVRGISVHLVEVSPRMKKQQEVALCGSAGPSVAGSSLTSWGCPVTWHSSLRDVPRSFSFFLAHEFLDALPVHKYEMTAEGWREVLVDLQPGREEDALRWVIARHGTPSCVLLDRLEGVVGEQRMELCSEAGAVVRQLSGRVGEGGGAALIVDYGEEGGERDTLRAYRHHQQVDPLELPGSADITADVDFRYLRTQVDEHVTMFGPSEQGDFLHACGIGARAMQLVAGSEKEKDKAEQIRASYQTLTDRDKMGARFKFCSLHPASMGEIHDKYPPLGFSLKTTTDSPPQSDVPRETSH